MRYLFAIFSADDGKESPLILDTIATAWSRVLWAGLSNNASWIIHLPPHIWPSLDSEVAIICWQDPTPPGPVCNSLTVHYYTVPGQDTFLPQPFTDNLPSNEMIWWSCVTSLLFLADKANICIYIVTLLIGLLLPLSRNYSLLLFVYPKDTMMQS